jgi:shikimate dehydrogenase
MSQVVLTGCETSVTQLKERFNQREYLQEIRTDYIQSIDDELWKFLSKTTAPTIFTLRPHLEGGKFHGSIVERIELFEKAIQLTSFIDLEFDLYQYIIGSNYMGPLLNNLHKIVVSIHSFEFPENLDLIVSKLKQCKTKGVKLAIKVNNSAQVAKLSQLNFANPIKIVIAMGFPGIISRIRPSCFKSSWNYISTKSENSTAPGQFTIKSLIKHRVSQHTQLQPLALFGGTQIVDSPGMDIYNQLFMKNNLPYQYISIVENIPVNVFSFMKKFNINAASITMPLKIKIFNLCDYKDQWSEESNSVNTIILKNNTVMGYNTDCSAFFKIFENILKTSPINRTLILGAGGTTRSAISALNRLNLDYTIAVRDIQKAKLGFPNSRIISWEERGQASFDLLINTTPLGYGSQDSPWPISIPLKNRIVIDLVLTSKETTLIKDAKSQGSITIDGFEFWTHQGAEQMSIITGSSITKNDLISIGNISNE